MATVHGEDSAWLRRLGAKRLAGLTGYGALLIGTVIGAAVHDARLALVVLVAGISIAHRHRGLAQRYRHAKQGAVGELETATTLALLPASFTVVNDLSFNGFNVDHVVVGPTGVWAVETKSHRGNVEERADSVWLNSRRMYRDPRRQARAGAASIAELLERATGKRWWVEALVCFPHASVAARENALDACVVGTGQLLSRLRVAPNRLAPDERDGIVAVLATRITDFSRVGPGVDRRTSGAHEGSARRGC